MKAFASGAVGGKKIAREKGREGGREKFEDILISLKDFLQVYAGMRSKKGGNSESSDEGDPMLKIQENPFSGFRSLKCPSMLFLTRNSL